MADHHYPRAGSIMKRREFLQAAGLGLATTAVAKPAIAQSNPAIKWRLTASWPKSLDTLYGSCEVFAKRVGEITNNRFQVEVFASGEIVPGLAVLDAVQNQTVEMGHTTGMYYWGKEPALAFGTGIPFGLNTRQMESWMLHGDGTDLLQEIFTTFNCYGIPMGSTGARMSGWFRKEINRIEDLRGLKFRVPGLASKVVAKLGMVPQQIAPGDIYPSLEKGVIDAVAFIGPHDDEKLGFQKIAKYYYYPSWEGSAAGHVLVNLDKWNSLPRQYQAVVQSAAREASHWQTARYDAVNPPALRRLLAGGVQLRGFSQEIMEACYKAANEVYEETSAVNPRFKKIYDSLIAFRGASYLWWQVAEMSFDSFQIRMRTRT
jgi:TRAP-type mannitol/chloroaromatic compound transport system substrate-binding protein